MSIKSTFDYMETPLIIWAKSLPPLLTTQRSSQLNYENFPNGHYLFEILRHADSRLQNLSLPNEGDPYDTTRSRLLNLDFILRNIRSFYQDILNQILLAKLPNIYQIAKYPESEETAKEMEKMLLLLLGIAINGDLKESFIDQIQQKMDTKTQLELVPYLKLVNDDINFSISKSLQIVPDTNKTDIASSVCGGGNLSNFDFISTKNQTVHNGFDHVDLVTSTIDAITNQQSSAANLQSNVLKYGHMNEINFFLSHRLMPNLQRIVDERDSYLESIIELEQDKDYLHYRLNNSGNTNSTSNQLLNTANNILNVNNNGTGNNSNGQSEPGNSGQSGVGIGGGGGFNEKQFLFDALNAICSSTSCSAGSEVEPGNSLVNLSDTQTLVMLIESIYKEISLTSAHTSESEVSENLVAKNGESDNGAATSAASHANKNPMLILNDLKSRKFLTNNWNQKIAIELVECKIKLKQLINEM